ncbi:GAF domain-containing protein [Microbacterium profundi]|uniref:GAF domain-containing protein n=1 Tax=Microbacterium profundi TaxID=450380 RepID=UPI001F33B209|nr:GAF domain-containing protein [Microbacterium profundi]MCE7483081.1 GAF domain-containing protein [Microbacterium profundi]
MAEQVISVKKPVVGVDAENLATELSLHCRALVRDKEAVCDVNVYRLMSHGLDRVNRASREARISFKNTTKQTPRAIEERCTVERVLAGEVTVCPDVRSKRWQRRLSLEGKNREYRSFISVPVFNEAHKVIGMLSINSNKKNGLTDLHRSHLEAAAKLYARAAAV